MNFFAALSIFHIISPPVDVSNLPLISTTYLLDNNQVAVPWRQTRWEEQSDSLVRNTILQHNSGTTRIDTSIFYMHLNAAKGPEEFTAMPNEDPIQNGTEFLYAANLLDQRKQYQNGKTIYTAQFKYKDGLLDTIVTSDSAGPFNTTSYTYMDGRISEIEAVFQSGYSKIKYTYIGTDTIESRDYDSLGVPSSFKLVFILENGILVKENDYNSGKLFGYTIHEYPSTTALLGHGARGAGGSRRAGDVQSQSPRDAQSLRDALGRDRPSLQGAGAAYLTGAGAAVGLRIAR